MLVLCVQFLDPEQAILTRLTTAMENMKALVLYDVDFYNLWHLSNMLCLIRSSPNLQSLKILVVRVGTFVIYFLRTKIGDREPPAEFIFLSCTIIYCIDIVY